MKKIIIKIVSLFSFGLLMMFNITTIKNAPMLKVQINDVRADTVTCCVEFGSICVVDEDNAVPNYYKKEEGSCDS
ncbi:MAG: hypothetical protein WEA56_08145 [Balneolaceae bacterium]